MKSLFLTYNHLSIIGKNTALRLQTISHLYQKTLYLPARPIAPKAPLHEETARRIAVSDLVLVFQLEERTRPMQQEIDHALKISKPILELHAHGKVPMTRVPSLYHSVAIDYVRTEQTLQQVASFLDGVVGADQELRSLSMAVVGIGLGMLSLGELVGVKM